VINVASYCVTLIKLKSAIPCKRPGFLRRGVVFLEDDEDPTQQRTQKYTFFACDGGDWDTRSTAPILHPQTFTLSALNCAALSGLHFRSNKGLRRL
ncbi:hypothetical protein AVEN_197327-1, partial [Araneus ventricosus]